MSIEDDPPRLFDRNQRSNDSLTNAIGDFRADGPTDVQVRELATRVQLALAVPPLLVSMTAASTTAASTAASAVKGTSATAIATGFKTSALSKISALIALPLGIGVASGVMVSTTLNAVFENPDSASVTSQGPRKVAKSAASARNASPRSDALATSPQGQAAREEALLPQIPASQSGPPRRSTAESPPVQNELELLEQAQATLTRDPEAALRMVSRHASQFKTGRYAQEREIIAIDALLRLGRRVQAEARGRKFQAQYPDSPYARRIDVLLGAR